MSEGVCEMPGDVWITVNCAPAQGVHSKYYTTASTVGFPFGPHGPAILESRFNLTAYVRDMITEAMGK